MNLGKVLSDGFDKLKHTIPALDGLDKLTHGMLQKMLGAVGSDGKIGGEDPAKIFHWFNEGNPSGYEMATKAHGDLGDKYSGAANDVAAAKRALGGWSGKAADEAHGAIDQVTARFDAQGARSTDTSSKVGAQVDSFHNTKHKVQHVPSPPPQGGSGLEHLNPATLPKAVAGDVAVVGYQERGRANQEAYQGYGGATGPQGQGLPQDKLPPPRNPHDTTVDPGKTGKGHDYKGHTDTSQDQDGVSRKHGPSGPGITSTSGFAPSTSAPPGAHGGYQPTPTGSGSGSHVPAPGGAGGGANGPYGNSGITGANPNQGAGGLRPTGPGSAGGAPRGGAGGLGGFAPLAGGGAGGAGDTVRGKNGSWSSRGRGGIARGGSGGFGDEGSGARGGKAGTRPIAGKAGMGAEGEGARSGSRPGGAAAAEAAERSTMARGAAGKPGASAIPPGAAGRGKKDEDEAHKSADYLQNNDFHDEVVGSIERTAPPVIGEFDADE